MKVPKKAEKCVSIIDNLVNLLGYYMGGTPEFKRMVREDIGYLEEYLQTISEDHKIHNIKLATKLKARWKKEMKEKDSIINDLKKELKERSD